MPSPATRRRTGRDTNPKTTASSPRPGTRYGVKRTRAAHLPKQSVVQLLRELTAQGVDIHMRHLEKALHPGDSVVSNKSRQTRRRGR